MNSMTGYGRGEASNGDVTVVVEIKSVNNRFRDINLRVPREYLVLEPRVTAAVRERVQRGRLDVYVRRSAVERADRPPGSGAGGALPARHAGRRQAPPAPRRAHPPLARPRAARRAGPRGARADALTEWHLVETAIEAALTDLIEMRTREGARCRRTCGAPRRPPAVLGRRPGGRGRPQRAPAGQARRALPAAAGEKLDPARLAQEAAILADKADISERLARLLSHCRQFSETLAAEGPVGRKLEFLVQEAQPGDQHHRQQGRGAHRRGAGDRDEERPGADEGAGGQR